MDYLREFYGFDCDCVACCQGSPDLRDDDLLREEILSISQKRLKMNAGEEELREGRP